MNILTPARKIQNLYPWSDLTLTIPRDVDTIAVFDADETLYPWSRGKYREEYNKQFLTNNQTVLKELYGRTIIAVATGIDWGSFVESGELLKDFPPFDFVSTGNGLELRFNSDSTPNAEWVKEYKDSTAEQMWNDFINSHRWDKDLFFKVAEEELKKIGFRELSPFEERPKQAYSHQKTLRHNTFLDITAVFSRGETAIYLLRKESADYRQLRDQIMSRIIDSYANEKKVRLKHNIFNHGLYDYLFFLPETEINIDKSIVFDAILNSLPKKTKGNIRAL
jgi:hypothetical protein